MLDYLHADHEVEPLGEGCALDVQELKSDTRRALARERQGFPGDICTTELVSPRRGKQREELTRATARVQDRLDRELREHAQRVRVHVPMNGADPLDITPSCAPQ